MPYQIDKQIGGDSPENVRWMERCVKEVMKTGKDKDRAIAICKATLKKSKGDKSQAGIMMSLILNKELRE